MVINDHDTVDTPAYPVFCNVREVAGVRLPHLPERVFLKCPAVTHGRVFCGFQVMVLDEPLDSAHADGCRDERACHKLAVDLCCVQPWEFRFQAVDLVHGGIRERACPSAVRAFFRHERVNPPFPVKGFPLGECPWLIVRRTAVRECERLLCDALIISVP